MKNLITGLVVGLFLGILSHYFFRNNLNLDNILTSSFVISSILTGLVCALIANFLQWDFGILLGSLVVGIIIFFIEFLITGEYLDPLFRGAIHGIIFGAIFSFYIVLERRKELNKKAQS